MTNITIDYVQQIRNAIVGQARKWPVNAQHYVDGARFWKLAYENLESENSKLMDRIFELEHLGERSLSPSPRPTSAGKRKIDTSASNKANIQTKRRKIEPKVVEGEEANDLNDKLNLTSPSCRKLVRIFYQLRCDVRQSTVSVITLCRSVIATAHAAEQLLENMCHNDSSTIALVSQIPNVRDYSQALMKVWVSILQAVQRIGELDQNAITSCIPQIVCLFQKLLGRIQQICLDGADFLIKTNKKSRKRSQSCAFAFSRQFKKGELGSDITCKPIVNAMRHMFTALDVDYRAHQLVFEGIMCALLDHIGSSISLLVFAEPDSKCRNSIGIVPPRGLVDVAHIDNETATLTSRLAAPYLVATLKQAMSVANQIISTKGRIATNSNSSAVLDRIDILSDVKEKLQNTLLRGMFDDTDSTFKNALQRAAEPKPAGMDDLLNIPEPEESRSDWFIGQVWEHLGWDILVTD